MSVINQCETGASAKVSTAGCEVVRVDADEESSGLILGGRE